MRYIGVDPSCMADMNRLRVTWSGATGLPGISTFYLPDTLTNVSSFVTFFNAIKAAFPSGLTWVIDASGDVINDTNGLLVGAWSGTGASSVTATGGSNYGAGMGGYITWNTTEVIAGRRLKGRTFLAPLDSGQYDNTGTLLNSTRATINAACTVLVAASGLLVWHKRTGSIPNTGSSHPAVSGIAPDRVTMLRSRRD